MNISVGLLSVNVVPSTTSVIAFGESLTLSCVVNHNITDRISYIWSYNNNHLLNGQFVTLTYSDYLSVSRGGSYSCVVYISSAFVEIGESPPVSILFSPSFSKEPSSRETRFNDSIELSCTVFGFPVPEIEWIRISSLNTSFNSSCCGIDLPEGAYNDTTEATYNATSILIIDDIEYVDFGYYLCVSKLPVNASSIAAQNLLYNFSSIAVITGMCELSNYYYLLLFLFSFS